MVVRYMIEFSCFAPSPLQIDSFLIFVNVILPVILLHSIHDSHGMLIMRRGVRTFSMTLGEPQLLWLSSQNHPTR